MSQYVCQKQFTTPFAPLQTYNSGPCGYAVSPPKMVGLQMKTFVPSVGVFYKGSYEYDPYCMDKNCLMSYNVNYTQPSYIDSKRRKLNHGSMK